MPSAFLQHTPREKKLCVDFFALPTQLGPVHWLEQEFSQPTQTGVIKAQDLNRSVSKATAIASLSLSQTHTHNFDRSFSSKGGVGEPRLIFFSIT